MKLKYAFITLSLLGGVLTQPSFAMDPPMGPAGIEGRGVKTIPIPSDPDITGLQVPQFSNSTLRKSWGNLISFTNQSIENLKNGNPRGIFFLHSIEDIMGAMDAFKTNWNKHHPLDQRELPPEPTPQTFHTVFSHQEYIDHYIDYVLASRPLISGSILALHENPVFTVSDSFAPVSFIMHVPAECIGVVSRKDAHTPVDFLHKKDEGTLNNLQDYIQRFSKYRSCLDALVRYPDLQTLDGKEYAASMNEVAILNCAKDGTKMFKPSIIGVHFNESFGFAKADYGNASRNIQWKEAAQEFSKAQQLPFLTFGTFKCLPPENFEQTVVREWFGHSETEIMCQNIDAYICGDSLLSEYIDDNFLLSNEQLKGYGLKR